MIEQARFGWDSHLANIKYKTNKHVWLHLDSWKKWDSCSNYNECAYTNTDTDNKPISFLMCCIIWSSACDAQWCERKELAINLKSVCVFLSSVHDPNKLNLRRKRECIRGL